MKSCKSKLVKCACSIHEKYGVKWGHIVGYSTSLSTPSILTGVIRITGRIGNGIWEGMTGRNINEIV